MKVGPASRFVDRRGVNRPQADANERRVAILMLAGYSSGLNRLRSPFI